MISWSGEKGQSGAISLARNTAPAWALSCPSCPPHPRLSTGAATTGLLLAQLPLSARGTSLPSPWEEAGASRDPPAPWPELCQVI